MGYSRRWDYPTEPKPVPKPDPEKSALSLKIAEVVVDRINISIIRPGPEPEERECYDVARELRAFVPDLQDLIYQMLEVHEQDGTAPIPDITVRGVLA